MAVLEAEVPIEPMRHEYRLRVAVCGSFRRDQDGLRVAVAALEEQFIVLSPSGLDFVDPRASFVRLPHELDESEASIERRHLDAMSEADLIWLHTPNGYVGTSAAMELGHAAALGIPVFAQESPDDPVLASLVEIVPDPHSVSPAALGRAGDPGRGVDRLQRYYRTTALRRGWAGESPRDTLLLLTEELGELARAVRKAEGISRQHAAGPDPAIEEELADLQLYLVHLANSLGMDLSVAVTAKERVNAKRFETSRSAA